MDTVMEPREMKEARRSRPGLTLKEKQEILQLYPAQMGLKQVMPKYNINSKGTIAKLVNRKEEILAAPKELVDAGKKYRRKRKLKEIEQETVAWFTTTTEKGCPVPRKDFKYVATQIAKRLKKGDFKGSDGWTFKVMRRNNIRTINLHGEEGAADPKVAEQWKSVDLPEIIQNYRNSDIFNCDETGVICRSVPRKTLAFRGKRVKGPKQNKSRLSVHFCCTASGHKLPPLVIGNSKNPRAFVKAKLNCEAAGFTWRHNKTSWMTNVIFKEWLAKINEQMVKEGRNVLMLLDNFSAHKVESPSNIKLVFLPPNQTCKVQPLDLGIIKSYKNYEDSARARHRWKRFGMFSSIGEYLVQKSFQQKIYATKMDFNVVNKCDIEVTTNGRLGSGRLRH